MNEQVVRPLRLHPVWLGVHALIIVAGFTAIFALPSATRSAGLLRHRSPATVIAHHMVKYPDVASTNRERALAVAAVPPVYRRHVRLAIFRTARAGALLNSIIGVLHSHRGSLTKKQAEVQQLLVADSVPTGDLVPLGPQKWRMVRHWSLAILESSIYEQKPWDESAERGLLQILDLPLASLPSGIYKATTDIVQSFITPTRAVDNAATARLRRRASAGVKPVIVPIPAGTVVVVKGQVITPAILQELRAVGLPSGGFNPERQAGALLFAGALVILALWYLRAFHIGLTGNPLLMLMLDATILATLLAAKLALPGHGLLPYFFPLAGASALVGLLVTSDVGVTLAVVLGLLLGWLIGGSFEFTAFYLLTGVAGAMAVRQLRRMNDFILVGVVVAVTAGIVIAAFRLMGSGLTIIQVRDYAAAAGFNGLVSGALAFGGFVLLGNTFGITTNLYLLELGHPEQKLLRRLMAEAPGTYNHSLVVASMVEGAAAEIAANVLLARVMALYHDIGKVANPLCFIENQMGTANIHDDLKPLESAEIIRAHVTHGVVLARQHRLPAPIRDAIQQHHGTMTMAYFFHQALQDDPTTDAAIFTYPGPRPRSRECALLMLADGCESAVRANERKNPEIIRDTVDRIIDDRVGSGQLSQCSLTLRDLATVRTSFAEVLNGIYHPRIEYPDPLPSAIGTSHASA